MHSLGREKEGNVSSYWGRDILRREEKCLVDRNIDLYKILLSPMDYEAGWKHTLNCIAVLGGAEGTAATAGEAEVGVAGPGAGPY